MELVEIVKSLDVYKKMSLGEQLDALVEKIVEVQKEIVALARKIVAWQNGMDANEDKIKAVVKSLKGVVVKKSLIRDILKGEGGMLDRQFWVKEESKLKKYTESLRYVI